MRYIVHPNDDASQKSGCGSRSSVHSNLLTDRRCLPQWWSQICLTLQILRTGNLLSGSSHISSETAILHATTHDSTRIIWIISTSLTVQSRNSADALLISLLNWVWCPQIFSAVPDSGGQGWREGGEDGLTRRRRACGVGSSTHAWDWALSFMTL